jgi:STE24 endopeptidase
MPLKVTRLKLFRILLLVLILLYMLSPFLYWSTGIGQQAIELSAEVHRAADGTLQTSPRAEARHTLLLPMRIQSMILYPLLLVTFYLSGYAIAFRRWLETRVEAKLRYSTALPQWSRRWINKIPEQWRSRLPGTDMITVLLFIVGIHLALTLIYLPLNFYRSFVVGHQFGLVTLTMSGWLADWGKGLLINLIIAALVWGGFYSLMRLLPRRWPVVGGAALFLMTTLYVLMAPHIITPLFYSVTTMQNPELRQRITNLAARAGVTIDEVHIINASSKTTAVNAYFTGLGGKQRIVLYDTLLADYTPDQVEVVLAHELGHWYYHHVLLAIVGSSAVAWISLFGLRWLIHNTWQRLGLKSQTDIAGLPLLLAGIALIGMIAMPVENTVSRIGERQADSFALEVSQKPEAFVALFEQLAEQNLSIVTAPGWETTIFFTHPPIAKRVSMAEEFAIR